MKTTVIETPEAFPSDQQVKLLLPPENLERFYDGYSNFLHEVYPLIIGKKFMSVKSYVTHLRHVSKILEIDDKQLFHPSLDDCQKWSNQIMRIGEKDLLPKYFYSVKSAFTVYILYVKYSSGVLQIPDSLSE